MPKKQTSSIYALILAGGSGTRLWPRSRRDSPKQLLPLFSQRTMLQETYDRIVPILSPDRIFIGTNQAYVATVHKQLPEVPRKNIIGEPVVHGTAPSIGLAALHIQKRDPDAVMVSLHADHYIEKPAGFRRALLNAARVAAQGYLVTLGIQPSQPETGYGYVHRGELIDQIGAQPVYRVAQFVEKPDEETAVRYLQSGEYYWNSGIFAWQISTLFEEFAAYLPKLNRQLKQMARVLSKRAEVKRIWNTIADETIDVGIMEKSKRATVLPIEVGWNDVGNWATLFDLLPGDAQNNVVVGEHVGVNTSSSLLYSPNRLIATVGLSDMIVIDTDDAILVCHKKDAQQVKHIVEALKKKNKNNYL